MRRFYIENTEVASAHPTIRGIQARHIRTVLRLKAGDPVILFDGTGSQYRATITETLRDCVKVQIAEKLHSLTESPLKVTIGQGIIKYKKMDWIIQKATELGITTIIPFISSRSIPMWRGDKGTKKIERWRSIALESLKQCGRAVPPHIENIIPFDQILERPEASCLKIILWENAAKDRLPDVLKSYSKTRKIFALIGPEGGFTEDEVREASMHKFIPVKIGDRLLRAETAAMAFMSIVQYQLGDLR